MNGGIQADEQPTPKRAMFIVSVMDLDDKEAPVVMQEILIGEDGMPLDSMVFVLDPMEAEMVASVFQEIEGRLAQEMMEGQVDVTEMPEEE